MDPFQDPGPSHSHNSSEEQMSSAPGRKRVVWSADTATEPPTSSTAPEDNNTGSSGHNTPLQRSDLSQDDLRKMRESIKIALSEEYPQEAGATPPPVKYRSHVRPYVKLHARHPSFTLTMNPTLSKMKSNARIQSLKPRSVRASRLSDELPNFLSQWAHTLPQYLVVTHKAR